MDCGVFNFRTSGPSWGFSLHVICSRLQLCNLLSYICVFLMGLLSPQLRNDSISWSSVSEKTIPHGCLLWHQGKGEERGRPGHQVWWQEGTSHCSCYLSVHSLCLTAQIDCFNCPPNLCCITTDILHSCPHTQGPVAMGMGSHGILRILCAWHSLVLGRPMVGLSEIHIICPRLWSTTTQPCCRSDLCASPTQKRQLSQSLSWWTFLGDIYT